MDLETKRLELEKLRAEILLCQKCPLFQTRQNVVPGAGDLQAMIMFIGEAPGASEDEQGIPFCGAAGKFLDEMLASIGLSRDQVYIANTLKCRPPANRDPEPSEKEACRDYLLRQFEIIDPPIVVCLGRHSVERFLPTAGGISKIHGKPFRKKDGRIYLPLYHPAAALHNGGLRATLLADFQKLKPLIKKVQQEAALAGSKSSELKQETLI